MAHERSLNSPVDGPAAVHGAIDPRSGPWADVWRYAYWIVLDRGIATLIAQWVAEAGSFTGPAASTRIACLATARRIAIGMAPGDVLPAGDRDDDEARIATLPRGQREVLVLRHLLGLGDAEIAVVMGCRRWNLPTPPSARAMLGDDRTLAPGA